MPADNSVIRRAIEQLREISKRQENGYSDIEADHAEADRVLLSVISDEEIEAEFEAITKWYA